MSVGLLCCHMFSCPYLLFPKKVYTVFGHFLSLSDSVSGLIVPVTQATTSVTQCVHMRLKVMYLKRLLFLCNLTVTSRP